MEIALIKFIVCAGFIFFSGTRVALYGDVIAEKTGLSGLWIGIILVSVATSLPELFTGVGSVLFVDAPDLTVGNLFGANTYNLLNLVLLDFLSKNSPILSVISTGQLLTAALTIVPVTIAAIGIYVAHFGQISFSIANISFFSIAIFLVYIFSARTIFYYEKHHKQIVDKLNKEEKVLAKYTDVSLKKATFLYGFFALIIAGAGVWLGFIGDELSQVFGVGQNCIGSLFLGLATTLPEVTVSVAALRLGAKEMAVANMMGSNLFNITIIFFNDVLYRKAAIFDALSVNQIFTACIVILMTVIVMAGLILKPCNKTRLGISWYAILLIIVFAFGVIGNTCLGNTT